MKKYRGLLFVMAFVLGMSGALAMEGCAATPRQQYAQVQDTFITTLQVLLVAKETGEFTDEEWYDEILPLLFAADDLLTEFDNLTAAGESGDTVLAEFHRVLLLLRPFIARAQS